ncbi:MAG: hypothetical protein NTU61_06050 [Candidatus Altiarchaeota archaeon]|nr:hypothetical protein [Candidatus Altiarchaeota archaeon]
MKILAFSDCVIIAGDLGGLKESKCLEQSKNIINEISGIKAPIMYVQGNTDKYPFETIISPRAVNLHLNPTDVGEYTFIGYSGCIERFSHDNPSLRQKLRDRVDYFFDANIDAFHEACEEVKSIRENELNDILEKITKNRDKIVIIAHERISGIEYLKIKPFLHIYGHRHKAFSRKYKGVQCINVAELDDRLTREDATINNYVIIDVSGTEANPSFHRIDEIEF